ncbi:hypothetical protein IMCC1989_2812 [gamma proteobacterium IMCC1989]|nr:hypothetical protein IMCC1989_2812 [gamma proteobacterium IMCC1989]
MRNVAFFIFWRAKIYLGFYRNDVEVAILLIYLACEKKLY